MRIGEIIVKAYISKAPDGTESAMDMLSNKPVRELVRCKDCKFHGNLDPNYCVELEQITSDEFYCGYGKPRH